MYTILVNDDNTLLVTVKERIMQKSKMVDQLHFLVNPTYKGIDMSDFIVAMKYKLPISNEPCSELLTLSEELYQGKLEYVMPVDTKLTKEAGDIKVTLVFLKQDLDEEGNSIQYVRPTGEANITIVPISAWTSIANDTALNVVDQKLLEVDAKIKALEDLGGTLDSTKADNIVLDSETHEIYLTADGVQIGDKISMDELGESIVASASEGLIEVII